MSPRRFAHGQDSRSVPTRPSARPGTWIFATTIFADLPGALFRYGFGWWLASSQHDLHQSVWPAFVAILCAATPYLWALLTLRFGGGAHLTLLYHRAFSNARRPSTSESKQIAAILQQFARLGAITPRHCFVIYTGNFNAWVHRWAIPSVVTGCNTSAGQRCAGTHAGGKALPGRSTV